MGQTAEKLREAGTHTVVVIADAIQVRDPDDVATDPKDYVYVPTYRGATVELDEAAYKRQVALDAVADPDSAEAQYALRGMRSPDVQTSPPGAMPMMGPTAEAVRAHAAAAGFPGGPNPTTRSSAELVRLPIDSLKIVAAAFGVSVSDDDTKESLAKRIAGEENAVETSTIDAQRAARDQRQLDARELGLPNAQHVTVLSDEERDHDSTGESDVGHGLDEEGDAQKSKRGGSETGPTAEDVAQSSATGDRGGSKPAGRRSS